MTIDEMVNTRSATLPSADDVGRVDEWVLPTDDTVIRVYAQFIGFSSSQYTRHSGHSIAKRADVDVRCRACRCFEPRIFREVGGDRRYLIHRAGCSKVPGEITLSGHEWARSPHEVIEALTTRKRDPITGDRTPYLTNPAARVLAQAAAYDGELGQAYVDRAVA